MNEAEFPQLRQIYENARRILYDVNEECIRKVHSRSEGIAINDAAVWERFRGNQDPVLRLIFAFNHSCNHKSAAVGAHYWDELAREGFVYAVNHLYHPEYRSWRERLEHKLWACTVQGGSIESYDTLYHHYMFCVPPRYSLALAAALEVSRRESIWFPTGTGRNQRIEDLKIKHGEEITQFGRWTPQLHWTCSTPIKAAIKTWLLISRRAEYRSRFPHEIALQICAYICTSNIDELAAVLNAPEPPRTFHEYDDEPC